MAQNLSTINKLIKNRFINTINTLSSHKLCHNFNKIPVNEKKLLNNRKYVLMSCSTAFITTIFGSNLLINYYKNNNNNELNEKNENVLMKLLSNFELRRAELFLKDNDQKKDNKSNDLLASKKYNFIADVTEKVSSAVVFIEIKGKHPFFPNPIVCVSSGSGFIVDSSGLILTNAHVVANYKKVSVKLNDGRLTDGVVECVDERLDLATIRINLKDLPFIKLGDSRTSRPGEWVIAMGSPFSLSNTITVGVISSINRRGSDLGLSQRYHQEMDYIQTDASINLGNSGGPLVNLDGEAIGINTMKVTAGISFAIPSTYAIDFLERAEKYRQKVLLSKDKIEEPILKKKRYIGVTMLTLTPQLIEQFQLREKDFPNVSNGVLILRVILGSPAYLEGLQPEDIITKINGQTATSVNDIYKALESDKPLNISVKRKDREINLVIKPQIVD